MLGRDRSTIRVTSRCKCWVEPWRAFLRPSGATGNNVLESESRTQAEELGVVVKEVGLGWVGWWGRGWTRSM